jgi:hypothetical protein
MRVWDIHPGYLNRESLLGEHREVHALISIISKNKRGYARHPETRRWKGHLGSLRRRHALLVAEMQLRGYRHASPAPHRGLPGRWPERFVDFPGAQFQILQAKYATRRPGRIPLPIRAPQLWAHHKYSIMARDPRLYKDIGRTVARLRRGTPIAGLAEELTLLLRCAPSPGNLRNALEHMWGHVSRSSNEEATTADCPGFDRELGSILSEICRRAWQQESTYLLQSTSLTDLRLWV